jgi:spore coat protein A
MASEYSRRQFFKIGGGGLLGLYAGSRLGGLTPVAEAAIAGGTLDPVTVPKYLTPLLIPPVMPKAGTIIRKGGKNVDYYEISMRQITQQILPGPGTPGGGLPPTTVWGYGAVASASKRGLLIHNAPSLTIEAKSGRPVRVKWIN